MSDDAKLLQAYGKDGSEPAFRGLVERHLPFVMAAARRIVAGDEHLAQDVTQLVFTDLARKAGSLPPGVVLGGWLHRHTCFTAAKAVRTESRRRARERTAMEINAVNEDSARDTQWQQLAPVLDDALNHLSGEDRDAIVLRYFERRDLRAIGAALGISDDTAQKRISRALEKLRDILTRRDVTVSTVLLSSALDVGAAAMPVTAGLAATVSTTALSGAAAVTTATAFTLTSLLTMTSTKIVLIAAAVVVATGITTVIVRQNDTPAAPAPTTVAAPVTNLPIKTATVAKVEAPNVAPVPASGAAVVNIPADPAATVPTGSLTFSSNVKTQKWSANATGGPSSAPALAQPIDLRTQIETKKRDLEAFKQSSQMVLDQALAKANGDPAELAKMESARQQYDGYAKTQQKVIDEMELKLQAGGQP